MLGDKPAHGKRFQNALTNLFCLYFKLAGINALNQSLLAYKFNAGSLYPSVLVHRLLMAYNLLLMWMRKTCIHAYMHTWYLVAACCMVYCDCRVLGFPLNQGQVQKLRCLVKSLFLRKLQPQEH